MSKNNTNLLEDNAVDFHSLISSRFNEKYSSDPNFIERFKIWTNYFVKHIPKQAKVLDAGCGPGLFSYYLAEELQCKVTAIDGSEGMIEICRNQKHKENIEIEFITKNLLEISSLNLEKQDVIIASSVLEYIDDLEGILDVFTNLLKDDGILIVSMPNKKGVARRLEKISYSILSKPSYYKYVKHIVTQKAFQQNLKTKGFKHLEHTYYATDNMISNMISPFMSIEYLGGLFIGAYKKESKK